MITTQNIPKWAQDKQRIGGTTDNKKVPDVGNPSSIGLLVRCFKLTWLQALGGDRDEPVDIPMPYWWIKKQSSCTHICWARRHGFPQ